MDIRRVQMTGGSSFVVTLPKDWTQQMSIKKNDPVRVTPQADGTLLISANISEDQIQRTREFDVTTCTNATFFFRSLIGAYIAGYTEIKVRSRGRLPSFVRMVVRDFTQMTIGQEVLEESETGVTIKDLLNPGELPFENTLRRMVVIVKGMHMDAITALYEQNLALTEEVIAQDRDVDRLHWLMARQTNMVMRNINLSKKMGLTLYTASQYLLVSRTLERIGDHAVKIARNAAILSNHDLDRSSLALVREASTLSLTIFEQSITAFFDLDMKRANTTIEEVKGLEQHCEAITTAMLTHAAEEAIAIGYIAESIRRLGEYSADIAENVINYVVEHERDL